MRKRNSARGGWILSSVLVVVAIALLWLWLSPASPKRYPVKCVIVGLDGLDPNLTRKWMDAGMLPNFARLAKEGAFAPLATSNPPQSPVAWSSFITGMNPGGTGIFDFVHRDPKNYLAIQSMSKIEPADPFRISWLDWEHEAALEVGGYRLPLRGDKILPTRQGTPFWKYLDDADIPSTVLRVPCNYPPTPGKTTQLSGMGTPDLTGSNGAFFYWRDKAFTDREIDNLGGKSVVQEVVIEDGSVKPKDAALGASPRLEGPLNVLSAQRDGKGHLDPEPVFAPFTVSVDKANRSIRIQLDGNDAVLKPGDWSDWMPVTFVLADWYPGNPRGVVRFRLKALEPNFELYATPVNIDPTAPAMPITNPPDYAKELAEKVGRFTTLGMPEDDKALNVRVRALDEAGFRQQCRQCLDDVWKTTEYELNRYKGGCFFTYFRTPDVMSHMMWFVMDPKHPGYDAESAKYNAIAIQEAYRWVDSKVGDIRRAVGDDALFIVMSDHGFAPFYRQMELNSWLADNGWLALVPWADRATAKIPEEVDWENTKAYCLGLNSLYINLKGREAHGAVDKADRDKTVRELCAALEKIVDPVTGKRVISKAYRREDAYSGAHLEESPDIVVGYNLTYRTSWRSALGMFPAPETAAAGGKQQLCYLTDNTGRWSGDHCCDPVHVPGLILMNRPLTKKDPGLTDVAPTILQEFGIGKPADMVGSPLTSPRK